MMVPPYDKVHATSQQLTHPFRLNCDKINAQLTNVAGPKQRKPFASLRRTIIFFPQLYYMLYCLLEDNLKISNSTL